MITLFEKKDQCCACNACASVCPQNAISFGTDGEGFHYPTISTELCVDCGKCQSVCPTRRQSSPQSFSPKYFGFQSSDRAVLYKSASGGAFTALSDVFFHHPPEGAKVFVYGACLQEDGTVAHRSVTRQQDLHCLRDSKYVESSLDACYAEIMDNLRQGAFVLFSGTPCQVYGLKTTAEHILDQESRERLLLVDIVCNGVGSPLAWDRFRTHLEQQAGQPLTGYTFRDKRAPRGYAVSWRTMDGQETVDPLLQNRYWLMYQRGFISRPSCSACTFTNLNRVSDITIGDFHGLSDDEQDFHISSGVSLVIATTEKGQQLCSRLDKLGTVKEFPEESALQPRLQSPAPKHPLRNLFLKDLGTMPFPLILKKYGALIGEKKTV